jgi:uncharacterized phage protein (TIGR01671 family)
MREIKFRVWHPGEKEMFYDHLNGWGESRVFIDLQGKMYTESWPAEDGDEYSLDEDFQDLIPMQYTGLKDKNGREIYEGDILQTDKGTIGVAEWLEMGKFALVFRDEEIGFKQPRLVLDSYSNRSNVVGNVYENPELLKA